MLKLVQTVTLSVLTFLDYNMESLTYILTYIRNPSFNREREEVPMGSRVVRGKVGEEGVPSAAGSVGGRSLMKNKRKERRN
jgi:hypothetical protein